MTRLFLIAGAAALGLAAPAVAGPGKGNKHANHGGHAMHGQSVGYGGGHCPPGLRNKGCMPPGQAKKYNVGQRYPYADRLLGYNQLPYDVRQRYDYDPYGRYAYDNGYYYQVDPKTMIIRSILGAILR